MTKISKYVLKVLRRIHQKIWNKVPQNTICEQDPNKASQLIYDALVSDKPCMIIRFGAFELSTMVNYLGVKNDKKNYLYYIKGNELDW